MCYTSIDATVSGHSHDQRKKLSKTVCSHPKMKQFSDSMHDCIMLLATTVPYPGFQYLLLFVEGIRTHFQNHSKQICQGQPFHPTMDITQDEAIRRTADICAYKSFYLVVIIYCQAYNIYEELDHIQMAIQTG